MELIKFNHIVTVLATAIIIANRDVHGLHLIYDTFVVSDESALYKTDASDIDILVKEQEIITFSNFGDRAVYYVQKDGRSIKTTDSILSLLLQPRSWKPISVAVDKWNSKVYAIDELADLIYVLDINGKGHYSIVLSDLRKPSNIVVDSLKGVMFFVQSLSAIYRAGLDGTGLTKIVERNGITDISLDIISEEPSLYWSTIDGYIETSDYQGDNRRTIKQVSTSIKSFAVANGTLAWITPPSWTVGGALTISDRMNTTTFRSTINTLKNPNKVIHISYRYTDRNPCNYDNDGCEHLCLHDSTLKTSCACHVGWQLNDDLKTCSQVNNFILYMQGNVIRSKILDVNKESFTDAIIPISLSKLSKKQVVNFDYDLTANYFFITGDRDWLYCIDVITEKETAIDMASERFKSIAVDWISGNAYIAGEKEIMIYNYRKNIYSTRIICLKNYYKVLSLAIHPNRGYLFFSVVDSTSDDIMINRMNTDVTNMTTIVKTVASNTSNVDIDIDYDKDRIYWTVKSQVFHANLDGNDLKVIDLFVMENPRSISAHQDWMYIANLTSIWRFHKETGEDATLVTQSIGNAISQPISGVKIYSPSIQKINAEHPCAINNDDCEQLCFAIPGTNDSRQLERSCASKDYEKLQSNQLSCS